MNYNECYTVGLFVFSRDSSAVKYYRVLAAASRQFLHPADSAGHDIGPSISGIVGRLFSVCAIQCNQIQSVICKALLRNVSMGANNL